MTAPVPTRRIRPAEWMLMLAIMCLTLVIFEAGLRIVGVPEPIVSGWRTDPALRPTNQLGWRGRPIVYSPGDFVVVLVGDSQVECATCPADETMDEILERAIRQHIPNARVVTLGARGFGQDQEYLAMQEYFAGHRADLVVNWVTPYNDVWNNTFRTPGSTRERGPPKPTFWLEGGALHGPTETIGERAHATRLGDLFFIDFGDYEASWARHLPPPDPGTSAPAAGMPHMEDLAEDLTNQRAHWSVWLEPRPARVTYGIELTRELLGRMRDLAKANGASFMLLIPDEYAPAAMEQSLRLGLRFFVDAPLAVGQFGHWYVADPNRYKHTVADISAGFDTVAMPITTDNPRIGTQDFHMGMAANRQIMRDLAAAIAARYPDRVSRP